MIDLPGVLIASAAVQAAVDRPGDDDGPGLFAFLIVAALALACVVLYRSLRRHLHKIDFEEPRRPGPTSEGSAGSEPT